ncbi:LmrA/YxaF family transcription factor [Streptomyces sp. CA-179760]|uniref:LmrA/YxaF family transcription factor n=1 Tax=Streptomyces sp. CA-179760 TaxID=3240054 RepID=UPI003D8E7329
MGGPAGGLAARARRRARAGGTAATLIVAAVEGTVAMCRAKRSTQPLHHTAEQLQAPVRAVVKD